MDYKYWAFISYSHRDNRQDGNTWGDWLHRAVENYRVPPELVNAEGRYGEKVPERLYPAFQDEKELPTNADLGQAINEALARSRYLVVICSPRAARSIYVSQEILEFKRLGRANRVLAIIIAGEPNASAPHKGADPTQECFPEALRHPLGPDGKLDLTQHVEPIAADVRGADGREASLRDRAHHGVLEREKLRVIAGLLGVSFDDLVQRDKERERAEAKARARRMRNLTALFAGIALVAVVAGIIAIRQTAKTKEALVRSDFLSGEERVRVGRYTEALAYFAEVLRLRPSHQAAASSIFMLLTQKNFLEHQAPLLKTDYALYGACFSPDGKILAISTHGSYADTLKGSLRLIDPQTGAALGPPLEDSGGLDYMGFSPDSRYVAARSAATGYFSNYPNGEPAPGICRRWEVSTGKKLDEHADLLYCPRHETIRVATADGTLLLSRFGEATPVSADPRGIEFTDPRTGARVGEPILLSRCLQRITFSPDGKRFAAATGSPATTGGEAFVWETASRKLLVGPITHPEMIGSVEFSPDGNRLVTASNDGTARVWDSHTGQPITGPLKHDAEMMAAVFSPDGHLVATSSVDRTVRLWNATTGAPEGEPLVQKDVAMTLLFSPDGRFLVSGGHENNLHLWRISRDVSHRLRLAHGAEVSAIQFERHGTRLATGSVDKSARIWDAGTGAQKTAPLPCHGRVDAVAFSPDGTRLATASGVIKETKSEADLWNAETGQLVAGPLLHDHQGDTEHWMDVPLRFEQICRSVRFSPDGKSLVTASQDAKARVWDAVTGAPRFSIAHDDTVYWAGYSPDGKWLISADGNLDQYPHGHGVVKISEAATGRAVHSMLGHYGYIYEVAFSGDGRRMVSASSDAAAQVWGLPGGEAIGPHEIIGSAIRCADLTRDGSLVALGATDRLAYLREVEGGKEFLNPLEHGNEIRTTTFTPDGKFLLTAADDGTVRLWDTTLGQPIGEPFRHGASIRRAVLNSDATRVAVACADGNAYVWDLAPAGDAPVPAWLSELAESVAEMRLNDRHLLEPVSADTFLDLKNRLSAAAGGDGWQKFARWYLASEDERTVSPWSTLRVADYVQRLIAEGTKESLDLAEKLAYGRGEWEAQVDARRAALK